MTLALKNLSHGLVNNVCRSHSSSTLNTCGQFIPAVVSMPVIRNKTVLHVLDGVKGLYHGGPGARPAIRVGAQNDLLRDGSGGARSYLLESD